MELISRTEDGLYRPPAFIDAHVHVESSHLTPARFGRLLAAQGTLAAVCDPHEIVNVMGEAGLEFMLAFLSFPHFRTFAISHSHTPTFPHYIFPPRHHAVVP